jgi:pimeloyl-ACP methyl ester carboxylesterase
MLNSRTIGNGNHAVIFIHGISQSLDTWDAVISQQSLDSYTRIAVDLPGHGQSFFSKQPEIDYSLKGCALQLANFLKDFEKTGYIVVTTSLGSNLLAEAISSINGCKGVFFIGGCIIGEGLTPADIMQPNADAMTSFMEDPSDEQLESYLNVVLFDRYDKAARAKYKRTFLQSDPMFRKVIAESIGKGEWSDEIKNIRNKNFAVALVYGKEDLIIKTDYLQSTELNKWKQEIILIDEAGHPVQLDQPKAIADLIAEFAVDCF